MRLNSGRAARGMRRSSKTSRIELSSPTLPRSMVFRLRRSSRHFSVLLQKSPPGPRRLASMSIEMRQKVCAVLASKSMLGTYVAFGSSSSVTTRKFCQRHCGPHLARSRHRRQPCPTMSYLSVEARIEVPRLAATARFRRRMSQRYIMGISFGGAVRIASPRRTQVLLLCYHRNYDRSIAGLGTGKTQRYFASDFDRLSNRLFDAS